MQTARHGLVFLNKQYVFRYYDVFSSMLMRSLPSLTFAPMHSRALRRELQPNFDGVDSAPVRPLRSVVVPSEPVRLLEPVHPLESVGVPLRQDLDTMND